MQFSFTDDQLALTEAVSAVLADWCQPTDLHAIYQDSDEAAGRSHQRWTALSNLGITSLAVSEADGGLGLGDVEFVTIAEAAGRAILPEPLSQTAGVVVPALVDAGVAHDRLAPFLDGGAAAVLAGVDFEPEGPAVTTTVIDGVATTPRVPTRGVSHALVAVDACRGLELHLVALAEVTVAARRSVDRTRHLSTLTWTPTDSTLVASGAQAAAVLDRAVDRSVLVASAELLGLCDTMLTTTAAYVTERKQFGVPVGSFQAVKHHLAGARVRLEFARPSVYRAAWSMAEGEPTRGHDVSMAKSLASDAADEAARVSLQCHGAIGYTFEHDLHLAMKRAWALAAAWGDARSHRSRVLRSLQPRR